MVVYDLGKRISFKELEETFKLEPYKGGVDSEDLNDPAQSQDNYTQ